MFKSNSSRFLGKASLLTLIVMCLAGGSFAQEISGPVVRCLGGDYFVVQCNGAQPALDEGVVVLRQGREVARGRVMRIDGRSYSILVQSGQAARMDVVHLHAGAGEARGPMLPSAAEAPRPAARDSAGAATPQLPARTARSKRDDYFTRLEGGRVLDLNAGEVITDR